MKHFQIQQINRTLSFIDALPVALDLDHWENKNGFSVFD
jgi:hypothetical protein